MLAVHVGSGGQEKKRGQHGQLNQMVLLNKTFLIRKINSFPTHFMFFQRSFSHYSTPQQSGPPYLLRRSTDKQRGGFIVHINIPLCVFCCPMCSAHCHFHGTVNKMKLIIPLITNSSASQSVKHI